MIVAIVLMAGEGTRMGLGVPKPFRMLENKPVFQHTVEQLLKGWPFDAVVLVVPDEFVQTIDGLILTSGGKSRRASCYQGLLACPEGTKTVVIHDAVRPFVSPRIVQQNVRMAMEWGAVDTCLPSPDTLVQVQQDNVVAIPDRSRWMRGQTPQSFDYALIRKAHETVAEFAEHVDDCRLVLELGVSPKIVLGEEANFKITTEADWERAEFYARSLSTL
jgi:ribitol-5-phosphate 2-dehydrogenase (NADP+) / D-ribitol-5-phosphate cytidylyltransferase